MKEVSDVYLSISIEAEANEIADLVSAVQGQNEAQTAEKKIEVRLDNREVLNGLQHEPGDGRQRPRI